MCRMLGKNGETYQIHGEVYEETSVGTCQMHWEHVQTISERACQAHVRILPVAKGTCSYVTSPYVIRNRSSSLGPAKNRRVIFSIDSKLCYKLCDCGNKYFEALLHF